MKDPWPWYRVLRDGILEHDLLRPIINHVLNYLVLQRSKGNYAAAAAINAAAVNGFIAEPAADSTQAKPIQDALPKP